MNQPELFDILATPSDDIRGMIHADDPDTSRQAARKICECRTKLHREVLNALICHGPLTDEELEQLPQFLHYGPSTIRKRRSELYQAGKIEMNGQERSNARGFKMKVWRITEVP